MPTPNDITGRMITALSASEPELDVSVGTPIRKILDAVSEAIAETQIDQYLVSYQYDIDSRSGHDLDAFVALFGFYRTPAKHGTGVLLLQRVTAATSSILIPSGSQAATSGVSETLVQTVTSAYFPRGTVQIEIPARTVNGGSNGNIAAGAVNRWLAMIDGISSVSNPSPFTGGDDMESDDELRNRFKKTSFRNLAGTSDMYVAMGLADAAVNDAKVYGSSAVQNERVEIVGSTATSSISTEAGSFAITAATNAAPIAVTTRTPHHLHNGDYVMITNVAGNTNANGFRRIKAVTGERSFTMNDALSNVAVAGNAAHTANTGTVTPVKRFGGMVARLAALGIDIDLGVIFPDTLYAINRTSAPPIITVSDNLTIPPGVYDLSYHYVSQASRNTPFDTSGARVSDRVDVWVDGERAQTATISSVVDASTFVEPDDDLQSFGTLRRSDWSRPATGNPLMSLPFSPAISLPTTFMIGNTQLSRDADYWLLSNEVVDRRGSMEYPDAIEFRAGAVDVTVRNIVSSTNANPVVVTLNIGHTFSVGQRVRIAGHATNTNANGDWYITAANATQITLGAAAGNGIGGATGTVKLYHPLNIEYVFNDVPLTVQRATEEWRMATSDLLVHKARAVPLRIYLAVILRPGYTLDAVQPAINNSLALMLSDLGIGAILQISDVLNVVTNVFGVDAARVLNATDVATVAVSGATNATPIVLTVPTNHGIVVDDVIVVQGVGGNTAANGTWRVQTVTGTTVTLRESAGNAAYTSGGTLNVGRFGIQVMAPNGIQPRALIVNTATPARAIDLSANDNEHFVLHSTVLSVKAQNSFGTV